MVFCSYWWEHKLVCVSQGFLFLLLWSDCFSGHRWFPCQMYCCTMLETWGKSSADIWSYLYSCLLISCSADSCHLNLPWLSNASPLRETSPWDVGWDPSVVRGNLGAHLCYFSSLRDHYPVLPFIKPMETNTSYIVLFSVVSCRSSLFHAGC